MRGGAGGGERDAARRMSVCGAASVSDCAERDGEGVRLTFELDIAVHEPNAVHPCDGTAQLIPHALERALAQRAPRAVAVYETKKIPTDEVWEDEHMVRGCRKRTKQCRDVRMRDVLELNYQHPKRKAERTMAHPEDLHLSDESDPYALTIMIAHPRCGFHRDEARAFSPILSRQV